MSPAKPSTRLHIVSGKGGTGKTTVAAALALALAAGGKKVLLCEVEGRQGIASLFDVAPLPYAERRIAVGPDHGAVFALAIDAEAALLEYLDMYYRLGRAGKALDRFGVIDFATTVAPGVRDVLLTGKVYEATRRQNGGSFAYDAIVLDAPPTGRITRFLNVNTEMAGIAKVGPIRNQSTSIMTLLKSEQTRVHLVTVLEDMPVQETLDCIAGLGAAGLPVGALIVNQVGRSDFTKSEQAAAAKGKLDASDIAAGFKEAGLDVDDDVIAGLLDEARQHAERVTMESEQRTRVVATGRPVIELPLVADGIDLGDLYEFADQLRKSEAI